MNPAIEWDIGEPEGMMHAEKGRRSSAVEDRTRRRVVATGFNGELGASLTRSRMYDRKSFAFRVRGSEVQSRALSSLFPPLRARLPISPQGC